ncbi:MAG TPA: MBL fold metallo-hydrolase [Longimicrobiales bacterium]|nr:MBL fold metallo-hydrolase [Longimicrobiales bacterium]
MRLTFLGTGTSFGVPVVGCDCARCASTDPRDRRTRHGALLDGADGTLLIDTPPELRLQLLRAGTRRVDAIWFTHGHADHTHGIDDLRALNVGGMGPLPAFANADGAAMLRERFGYIFGDSEEPRGRARPWVNLNTIDDAAPRRIAGHVVAPLSLPHGDMETMGFRVGGLGYVPDAQEVPAEIVRALRGVDTLVLCALWYGKPHPAHLNIERAVNVAADVGARITYLTHLTHRVGHADLCERLPGWVRPAHDGLVVSIDPPSEDQ